MLALSQQVIPQWPGRFTIMILLRSLWLALPILILTILAVEGKTSKVAAAWYAGWHSTEFPLSKISWSKYTHLTYAFAETTSSVRELTLDGSNPDLLPQFVEEAHKHGVKALIAIGGWSGSEFFSTNMRSAENRKAFVKTVTDFAKKYDLDGLNFDWQYPDDTESGNGCDAENKDDTAHFLLFLQDLRRHPLGSKLILSAATSIAPFNGPDGSPLSDVSGFAKVLDFIAILNYDIWGSWSPTVGPNAPLNHTCAATQNQAGSAVSAVHKWHKAGMPFKKIVLGVASYGHSFRVSKADALKTGSRDILASYPKFDASVKPRGDSWDSVAGVDDCGNAVSPGGIVHFWGLIQLGYLNPDGTVKEGILSRYDKCSQTPYVYNPKSKTMVSYDNAQSFAAKGKFIHENKLKGFSMWETGGDYNDILLDSIRKAGEYE